MTVVICSAKRNTMCGWDELLNETDATVPPGGFSLVRVSRQLANSENSCRRESPDVRVIRTVSLIELSNRVFNRVFRRFPDRINSNKSPSDFAAARLFRPVKARIGNRSQTDKSDKGQKYLTKSSMGSPQYCSVHRDSLASCSIIPMRASILSFLSEYSVIA
jgi:hypothetical protein